MRPYAESWRDCLKFGLVPLPTRMTGKGAGKAPAMTTWQEYQTTAPSMKLYESWEELHGECNIGTITGEISGIFVLDFDRRKENEPKDVLDGVDYFETVKNLLPPTPMAKTGGGGYHVFFRHPGQRVRNKTRASRKACVDIRGDGGFIVLPPSRKIGAGSYSWIEGLSPADVDFADAPQWVLDMAFEKGGATEGPKKDVIPEGYRNDTLFRLSCSLRNQGFDEAYILDQLRITNKVNAERGGKRLDDKELEILARQGAKYDIPKSTKKRKEDDEVEKVLTLPGKEVFIEEVRTSEGLRLLVRQDGEFSEHERYGMFVPDDHSAILEGVIVMPSGVDDYGTPEALFNDVQEFIRRYLDTGNVKFDRLYAAYVMLTWLYPEMPVLPMVSFVAPMGSAKTRALNVVGGLCYHSCKMVFPTEQVLYRVIDRLGVSICFEEQTVASSDREAPFIRVLNAGLEKGARVPRCVGESYEPGFFDIFCPKILARHEYYDDAAFESRCITCRIAETGRTDIPIVLTEIFYRERDALVRRLLRWRFDYLHRVDWDVNERMAQIRKETGASFRTLQVYSSILALGAHVPGLEETLLEHFSSADEQMREQKTDSATGIVVQALITLVREQLDRGYTLEESVVTPGGIKAELEVHYGGEFTATRISRILKPLGIVSKPRRVDPKSASIRCYVLDPVALQKAQEGYLEKVLHIEIPEVLQNVTVTENGGSVTHVTFCTDTEVIPEKMNKIDTGMSNSSDGGIPPPSKQKCNRQSVTGNVTENVTVKKGVQGTLGKGLSETFLCEECGHEKELKELAYHNGREICAGCWQRMYRECKAKGAKA